METGTDSTGVVLQEGPVNVPKLDCYYYNGQCSDASVFSTPQHLAHAYGEAIQGQKACNYTQDSDIQSASQDCYYFRHTNGQEFAFRYAQYNPKDSARAYPYLTDRIVKASASECFQYTVTKNPDKVDSSDGKQDTWLWSFHNSTFNGKITIPRRDATWLSTTYIYNGTRPPPNEVLQSCGTRCIRLYAWRSPHSPAATVNPVPSIKSPRALFECYITISEVSSVVKDWGSLPDSIAYYAAASIALTGRYTDDWRQFRLYPYG